MSLPFLETIGLTRKEADLYELLLRVGEVPAAKLIAEAKLKRATAYKSLYSLEAKGLVSKRDIDKIIHFRPEPPTKLIELAEARHHELDRARQDMRHIVPQLSSSYILAVEKPVVSVFEGVEGLKKIYEDTLIEGKPIYALVLPVDMEPRMLDYLKRSYRVRRAKLGIHAYVIAAANRYALKYHKEDKKYARTTLLVPEKKFPFRHEVDIYGDKVAFIDYRKDEPLIGVTIHHPQIAKTMKAFFDLAWEAAEKLYTTQATPETSSRGSM